MTPVSHRVCVCFCVFVFLAATALALPLERRPSQYVHDQWTKEDGLPLDMIGEVQQTPDGYLWIATQQGFARFDGREFELQLEIVDIVP